MQKKIVKTSPASFGLALRLADHHRRRSECIRRVRRPVVEGLLTQPEFAGWFEVCLVGLIAVMAQRLDAVRALLGVKEALPKDRPSRGNALVNLELRHHLHAPARSD